MIDPERKKAALESMAENYKICEKMDSTEARVKQAYLDGGREIWIVARAEGRVQGLELAMEELRKIKVQENSPLMKRIARAAEQEEKKHEEFLTKIQG